VRLFLYLIYILFVRWIPGGNRSIGKSIRRKFQKVLGIHLGANSVIGKNTYFSYSGITKISLGENSGIGPYSYIFGDGNVSIGNNVICAPRVTFVTRWHDLKYDKNNNITENIQRNGTIVVEDDVFIGTNVTILPNVVIGKGSIIGSGTIVYKSVPPGSKVFGSKMIISKVDML